MATATRLFFCPECEGLGGILIRHPSGNPELEEDCQCPECFGEGTIHAAADSDLRPFTPSRRRWTGKRAPLVRDRLLSMAATRRDALALKRAPLPRYPSHEQYLAWSEAKGGAWKYETSRLIAMRPVSGLARADMLAMARRCVNRVDALRGAA